MTSPCRQSPCIRPVTSECGHAALWLCSAFGTSAKAETPRQKGELHFISCYSAAKIVWVVTNGTGSTPADSARLCFLRVCVLLSQDSGYFSAEIAKCLEA